MAEIRIPVGEGDTVSGLVEAAPDARAWFVMAHGAGAGMRHQFMAAVARGLAAKRISVLRFQFPFMEAGSRRPDPPAFAQRTVRAAIETASRLAEGLPLFAGGKSYGGRMTSQAQAAEPLPGVRGLAFLGYPLHPAGKPGTERGKHLDAVRIPMLFVQGTRDALADLGLLGGLLGRLPLASLELVEGADHAFRVPVRDGRSDAEVLDYLCSATATWMAEVAGRQEP